ncbi:MAG: transcription-repair coupling factor [Myxococcales bacterium]|nr:transcription-repair coupling factor [Myxococcales bacterium]
MRARPVRARRRRDLLAERLVDAGYSNAKVVEDPGTFCVRGGIVDVYPPSARYPSRVELFGDVVDSIRLFDPASQRTLRAADALMIHPVRESVRSPETDARARLFAAADKLHFPTRATRALWAEVESGREFFGIEALLPSFHERLDAVLDYLPAEMPWVLLEPERLRHAAEQADEHDQAAYDARVSAGRLVFDPASFFVGAQELLGALAERPRVDIPLVDEADDIAGADAPQVEALAQGNAELAAELARARSERGEAILGVLVQRMNEHVDAGRCVVVAAGSAAHTERLEALLATYHVETAVQRTPGTPWLLDDEPAPPGVVLQAGDLARGFVLGAPSNLVVISEEEIFGTRARKRRVRRVRGPSLGDLRQLEPGAHVVHDIHGIGVYRGLTKMEVGGVPADFLLLEYSGGDRLYLPVYRMDQVKRYVADGGSAPRLDKLGGTTFLKKRQKVEREVRRFSEELLQLYAQRAALTGHAFPTPDGVFREFEASFPFSETADQLGAIETVLDDLQRPQPMDRLICGDVGFGKTEVALRAAFLAAMSGKQVAVLAPTTVLVEQHLRTFRDRMGPYPLRVESLSRFRRGDAAREVIAGLKQGGVDIVIGTHRLLSSDVRFRDLGLVIVDEEQRFGVKHKERLKSLRTQVDVLTLSATPIPRTMQMALTGLREVSVIATPPEDRLAVRTFLSRYDDQLVLEAVQRELDRGGQVFFVHNRIEDIARWAGRIAELLPRARVAVGHGQMDGRRLERVMLDFVEGNYEILVCTTIIESGLDIPRANTMFVNRADRYGLAQLYQLRGRIGRGRNRAYCYLLVPGVEALSDDARARLTVLQQFTELGSGFSIATHDLELRGAGDLLGHRQSGQIAAVGFETYARILEEAVAELKGEPISRDTDPEIKAKVAAFIPDDYVDDTGQRLELYQRLSNSARDEEGVSDVLAEIYDRYGPRPEEVDQLGLLMVVKGLAARLGATLVDVGNTRLTLTLESSTPLDPAHVTKLVSDPRSGYRLTPDMRLSRDLSEAEQDDPLGAAKKILWELLGHAAARA